jgi:4-amino-4-deoxy-L-arabinose transferase-like glycosyltransferase
VPLLGWVLLGGRLRRAWHGVAWLRGALLVLALTLPWYLLAESRTPGFLQYFIVGEHWHRFVTPGWSGDLYGSAHRFPRGSIWLFAAGALLPWSLLLPLAVWRGLSGPDAKAHDAPAPQEGEISFLLAWALMPCLFFTAAGNVLWTYVLPGLPALALLVGRWTASRRHGRLAEGLLAAGLIGSAAIVTGLLVAGHATDHFERRSARTLVQDFQRQSASGEALYFVGSRWFSGAFYSAGQMRTVAGLDAMPAGQTAWVVLGDADLAALPPDQRAHLDQVAEHGGRVLARWH